MGCHHVWEISQRNLLNIGHVSVLQPAFKSGCLVNHTWPTLCWNVCTWSAWSIDWRHANYANLNRHHAKSFFKNKQFRNHLTENWAFRVWVSLNVLLDFRLPDNAGPTAQHYQLQVFCTRKHQRHQEETLHCLGRCDRPCLDILEFTNVHVTSILNFQFPNIRRWSWWS